MRILLPRDKIFELRLDQAHDKINELFLCICKIKRIITSKLCNFPIIKMKAR